MMVKPQLKPCHSFRVHVMNPWASFCAVHTVPLRPGLCISHHPHEVALLVLRWSCTLQTALLESFCINGVYIISSWLCVRFGGKQDIWECGELIRQLWHLYCRPSNHLLHGSPVPWPATPWLSALMRPCRAFSTPEDQKSILQLWLNPPQFRSVKGKEIMHQAVSQRIIHKYLLFKSSML